jgi:hypothetical protein
MKTVPLEAGRDFASSPALFISTASNHQSLWDKYTEETKRLEKK